MTPEQWQAIGALVFLLPILAIVLFFASQFVGHKRDDGDPE